MGHTGRNKPDGMSASYTCSSSLITMQFWRWLAVEVAGLGIDIGVFATATMFVWSLHMPVSKRLMVSMVFLARLLYLSFFFSH